MKKTYALIVGISLVLSQKWIGAATANLKYSLSLPMCDNPDGWDEYMKKEYSDNYLKYLNTVVKTVKPSIYYVDLDSNVKKLLDVNVNKIPLDKSVNKHRLDQNLDFVNAYCIITYGNPNMVKATGGVGSQTFRILDKSYSKWSSEKPLEIQPLYLQANRKKL